MNLSKTSVKSLGVIISGALAFGTFFLVVQPLNEKTESNNSSLEQSKTITSTKSLKLKQLEAGVTTFQDAKDDTARFLSLNPTTKDVESVSRAMSTALVPGVSIVSFNFGNNETISPLKEPVATLGSYTPPFTLGKEAAPKAEDGKAASTTPAGGFTRVPVIVTVTASSNSALSQYADSLAKQPRLISVVSVDSATSSGEGDIKATIYGYAFTYAK